MADLDIESLLTNIPAQKTIIANIINDLFLTNDKVHNFEREDLKHILTFAACEFFFIFHEEYYTQVDPFCAKHLLTLFLCHFEKKLLLECPVEFLANFYKRHVDDIFLTFNSYFILQLFKFVDYVNQQHPNIKFIFEV